MLDELLGDPPEASAEDLEVAFGVEVQDAYDVAIDRALAGALQKVDLLRKERQKLPEALELLNGKGAQVFGREAPPRFRGAAGVEALLHKSWEMRYEDPQEMVFLAALACSWAQRLDTVRFGRSFVYDLQCRALIELGNAHRVADELDLAQKTVDEAARRMGQTVGDELLEARLCDVQASLHAARRFFSASCEALDTVHAIHLRHGNRHLAGRALLSKGVYTGYAGQAEEAENLIRRGLELVDESLDPALVSAAIYNLLYLLADRGDFRKARNLLFQHRPFLKSIEGRINQLKIRWAEGKIAAGTNKLVQAEIIFREMAEGFREEKLGYKAALASLELALVLRKADREEEARQVVLKAADAFLKLGIHREAVAAMLVLRKACEQGEATTALLQSAIYFLSRAEYDPKLVAEDFLTA
jgi:tetratricopeptide (TPR) repeat protein